MSKAFLRIREMLIEFPDGLTLGLAKLEHVEKGWVVKISGHSDYQGEDGMKKAFIVALETTRTIQGYKDGETELWDVVEIFDNEDEATETAKDNDQMTIYQIETGTLKWIV